MWTCRSQQYARAGLEGSMCASLRHPAPDRRTCEFRYNVGIGAIVKAASTDLVPVVVAVLNLSDRSAREAFRLTQQ